MGARILTSNRVAAALLASLLWMAAPAQAQDVQLQEAQGVLMRMGLFKGRPDGRLDPRTADALTRFQQQSKLPATGQLDGATLAALRRANDTKFSQTLGAPSPQAAFGGGATGSASVEPPKPRAAGPVQAVQSNTLAPPPGGRVPPTYLPAPNASAAGARTELSPPGAGLGNSQTPPSLLGDRVRAPTPVMSVGPDGAPLPTAAPRLGGPVQTQALAGSVGAPPPGDGVDGEPQGAARLVPYVLSAAAVMLFGFVGWLWAGPRLRIRRDNPLIAGEAAILDDGRRREPKF